jgi:metal-responsive CopG/Arc/MetJ family transcriptional regulator
MKTVQVVLDRSLLDAANRAARQMKQNRSALIRHALREHLERLDALHGEERDRAGYTRRPLALEETSLWEMEASWPAE